jgi:glutathione S-transferase
MKLYSNKLSPNAKRVRVCANELGVNLNVVELDFAKGEPKKPEYISKNPMGKVPTLEDDDGYVIWESNAILTYLATKNPQKNLFPTDAKKRADTMRWLFWSNAHYEQAVYGVALEKIIKPAFGGQPDTARIEVCTKDFERFAPVLNAQLEGKQFILGDSLSIADISLGVVTEFATVAGLDVSKYPHLKAWLGRLQERDSWKKASSV